MTAAALLHPGVSPKTVEPFERITSDLTIQADLANAKNLSAALIFGGDGTVHRHLPQLHALKIPALIVPKGSGNDFARALGITSERAALEAWRQFCGGGKNVREIDLGVIRRGSEETLFCCVAGAGLDAETNARANRMPAWLRGWGGYVIAALQTLAVAQPVEVEVTADTRRIKREMFFVAAGNAHRYGGGMRIAPKARLDDGLLDVCVVGKMSKLKVLCCLPTLFWGGHLGIREIEYFQAQSLRIAAALPLPVYADGEPAGQTPLEMAVLPRALKVIVPRPAAVQD